MADNTQRTPELETEARAVRESGALGKPGPLSRLFDFLLSRSSGPAPKEVEIAIEVFGKRPDFDVAQDSVVRVYVHKLRKRLDDFYARGSRPGRIVIPKGEYRLVFEATHANASEGPQALDARRPQRSVMPVAAAALLAGALLTWAAMTMFRAAPDWRLESVRASSFWRPLFDDELPITIVVGDYYLLGEVDEAGAVRRLVREFHINSQADFIDQHELDPGSMVRYRNLDLTYLPTSIAFALADLAPLLESKSGNRVTLMSELRADTLESSHVVYVGYLSGLGMLGDLVFDASRLQLGGTYDELVDPTTQRSYVARQGASSSESATDYAYFSSLAGPRNNRIVIIAGTRDLGVIESARVLTKRSGLAAIEAETGGADSIESLIQVTGKGSTQLNAERMFVAPIGKRRSEQE